MRCPDLYKTMFPLFFFFLASFIHEGWASSVIQPRCLFGYHTAEVILCVLCINAVESGNSTSIREFLQNQILSEQLIYGVDVEDGETALIKAAMKNHFERFWGLGQHKLKLFIPSFWVQVMIGSFIFCSKDGQTQMVRISCLEIETQFRVSKSKIAVSLRGFNFND